MCCFSWSSLSLIVNEESVGSELLAGRKGQLEDVALGLWEIRDVNFSTIL